MDRYLTYKTLEKARRRALKARTEEIGRMFDRIEEKVVSNWEIMDKAFSENPAYKRIGSDDGI